jgi:uncharacterized phage protein (TIGR01671 family)
MNREIKFRIWDKEQGKFYEPVFEAYKGNLHELLITTSGELCERTLDPALRHESCFPDRYELMQFTGLTDKNGKEIYEGDWIDVAPGYIARIHFQDGMFVSVYSHPEDGEILPICDITPSKCEVIGNIYENS